VSPEQEITRYLLTLANPEIATHSQRFFKTAEGEYGAGDQFLGIRVPLLRRTVTQYKTASLSTAETLLASDFHEIRLFSLLLLVSHFSRGNHNDQAAVYKLYLNNTCYINNWDLVDSSAPKIVGAYLQNKDKSKLYELAISDSLWERRIAIMATFHFIRNDDFTDALKLSEILLHDPEDLIHKAVGWMLREIGKRDLSSETRFLNTHYADMPRTMLRYAIEKFAPARRQAYLKGTV